MKLNNKERKIMFYNSLKAFITWKSGNIGFTNFQL